MALTKVTGQVIKNTTDVTVGVLTVTNTLAVGGTVSIGGTLTYEDVTNVDAVGLITARNGIVVGSGITLSKDGDGFFTGVVTATSYAGDGSALTGIDATQIVTGNTSVQTVDTGSDGHVKVNTEGSERLRIIADGKVGVNKTAPNFHLDVAGNIGLTEGQVLTWHDGSGTKAGDVYIDSSDNFIIRNTSSVTERLRVNSTGQLLINTTDGTGAYHLVVSNPSNSDTGMTFRGSGSSQQYIRFADGTGVGNRNVGEIEYNHGTNSLAIDTNGAQAVRIDSAQRVMIQTDTEGHADSDDLTIGDTGDNRIGITIRSAEYGNIFFSDATSGAAEYQGVLQYHHTDDVFNLNIAGGQKVTAGGKSLSLFGADNMSSRGGTYYGVDLAYKGSGIQGRSDNPTLDLCSNVSANSAGNGYVYGEGNTTAGQLSVGGNQLIFSSAGSGTAGASATLTEKFRFNTNNTLIFGRTTSNAPAGSVHIANAYLRLQAANQTISDFSQQVGIEWSQEAGSDVQVCAIKARRVAWGGAPHVLDFYTRNASNAVQRALILRDDQGATLTGSLSQNASDIRLKGDIEPIANALEKVNSLSGFTYNWNQKGKDLGLVGGEHDSLQVGLSAQDVEKVQPEVVKPAAIGDEYKTIQYEKLVPLLVESIKELSAKVDALENN